jgi:hypothetical protein
MRIVREAGREGRDIGTGYGYKGRGVEAEVRRLEVLREEEVLQLEEDLLRRLEEKLTPLVERAAVDAAKMAMHQLRLDLMNHISRHEDTIRRLKRTESALNHIPTTR